VSRVDLVMKDGLKRRIRDGILREAVDILADVREFMENLERFTSFFPRYKGMSIYGGVAGIHIEEDADKFAYRQGLFVLTGSGEGLITMLNSPDFKPKDFGQMPG